jgi:cytoskeletal protein CcmA (bactofilin family)
MLGKKEQKEVDELSNSSNIIGKGTILNGNLETFGNVRIEGKVIGNIKTKSKAAFGGRPKHGPGFFDENIYRGK